MLDQPAAIVQAGAEVLAHNAAWRRLTGAHSGNGPDEGHSAAAASAQHPEPGAKHQQLSLTRCLGDGRDAHALADTLASATPQHGSAGLALEGRACTARWVSLQPESNVALVVVEGVTATSERQAKVIARQRARIERLLIHQTIIEETERRRLGRALHDVVAQDLASVRAAVIGLCDISPGEAAPLAALLDGVIEQVRGLGGRFEIISAPGEGTRATVTLPLAVGPDASGGVDHG